MVSFAYVAAMPDNPYDGHTLARVVPDITRQIGVSLRRIVADAGYRGHNSPKGQGLSVFISGQKRDVTAQVKRELRRRMMMPTKASSFGRLISAWRR